MKIKPPSLADESPGDLCTPAGLLRDKTRNLIMCLAQQQLKNERSS